MLKGIVYMYLHQWLDSDLIPRLLEISEFWKFFDAILFSIQNEANTQILRFISESGLYPANPHSIYTDWNPHFGTSTILVISVKWPGRYFPVLKFSQCSVPKLFNKWVTKYWSFWTTGQNGIFSSLMSSSRRKYKIGIQDDIKDSTRIQSFQILHPRRFLIGWKPGLRRHSVQIFQDFGNWVPENKSKFQSERD